MDKILTAYGEKPADSIPYTERVQLLSDMCEALSIRGKDRIEFFQKLRKLVDEYSVEEIKPGKSIQSPYKDEGGYIGRGSFYQLINDQRNDPRSRLLRPRDSQITQRGWL